jgi:hypothetical protein
MATDKPGTERNDPAIDPDDLDDLDDGAEYDEDAPLPKTPSRLTRFPLLTARKNARASVVKKASKLMRISTPMAAKP